MSVDIQHLAFQNAPLGMAVFSVDGVLLTSNEMLDSWLQQPIVEFQAFIHPSDRRAFRELLVQLSEGETGFLECRLLLAQERWTRVHASWFDGRIVCLFEDITRQKQSQVELDYLFYFDALTKLPNRAMLERQIDVMLSSVRRRDDGMALLLIDLDRFKLINDTYGFAFGDDFLVAVAARLNAALRITDLLVRMGGDEFAILVLGSAEDARVVGRRVLEAFAEAFVIKEQEVVSSACVGVALFPQDASDATSLQAHADIAMFNAKEAGRGRMRFYGALGQHAEREQLEIEAELLHCIERQELVVMYQPQYDIRDHHLIGFEALTYWQHPKRGLLSPGKFIALAEQTGFITTIGNWVLEKAAWQMQQWNAALQNPLQIAVNLSATQLERTGFVAVVAGILERTGLQAGQLELEITESQIMSKEFEPEQQLHALAALGVHLAIDDFGTGYSNLGRLLGLPLTTLKIDRLFVMDLLSDPSNPKSTAPLVRSIVQLAHNLKLTVLAEGVETQAQLERLNFLGCDFAQGFYFAQPLSCAEAEKLVFPT